MAVHVDSVGDDLLACAAFSLNQDSGIALGYSADQPANVPDLLALSDDVWKVFLL